MTVPRRTRQYVVDKHWRHGLSAKKIQKLLRPPVGLTAVKDILRRFRDYGDLSTPCGGRRARKGKLPVAHSDFLITYLNETDSTLYLDEMAELLKRRFGRTYSPQLVCATLIRRGITRKKLSIINSRRCPFERGLFMTTINMFRADQLVCIDETRKDPRTLRRRYGRAARGARASFTCPFSRGESGYSALGIMTINGMIDCAMSQSAGVDATTFLEHVFYAVLPFAAAPRRPSSKQRNAGVGTCGRSPRATPWSSSTTRPCTGRPGSRP